MIKNPRWREEIDNYSSIKSAFVIEGNISDLQMYSSADFGLELTNLDDYLYVFLLGAGYQNIVFYNRVDGFYNNMDPQQAMDFGQLADIDTGANSVSIASACSALRMVMRQTERSVAVVMNLASLLTAGPDRMDEEEGRRLRRDFDVYPVAALCARLQPAVLHRTAWSRHKLPRS